MAEVYELTCIWSPDTVTGPRFKYEWRNASLTPCFFFARLGKPANVTHKHTVLENWFFFLGAKLQTVHANFISFFCFFFIRGEYREHCRREGCWETASISVTALFLTKQSDSIQQQFSERKHAEIWALSPAYHWHLWSLTLSLSLPLSPPLCSLCSFCFFFVPLTCQFIQQRLHQQKRCPWQSR